jgi:hypothetical protein
MEYLVTRLCREGKVIQNRHLLIGEQVRARLVVEQVRDERRRRVLNVARLNLDSRDASIPPLYEPQLVASTGACLSLAGYELVEEPATESVRWHGQFWLLSDANDRELDKARAEWSRLAALCAAHGIDATASMPELLPYPSVRKRK